VTDRFITVQDGSDCCVLALHGDIDVAAVAAVDTQSRRAIQDTAAPAVDVDLGDVTFMDSTGMASLVRIAQWSIDAGRKVRLRRVPPRVAKVLEVTQINTLFDGG
jgi:anti-sigma B factor antagonist